MTGSMDCDDALHRVYFYLDGELTLWRRQAIARHLDECPPCAEGFHFEIRLREIIATKCGEQAPDTLRIRVLEALGCLPDDPADADRFRAGDRFGSVDRFGGGTRFGADGQLGSAGPSDPTPG
jgi:mycothiol system anti-sigma-R factor